MTAPRHLWSGDWRRESTEAAEELARRQALSDRSARPARPKPASPQQPDSTASPPEPRPKPASPPKPKPTPPPARPTEPPRRTRRHSEPAKAALARLRGLRAPAAVLTTLAVLFGAGVGYAAVSALTNGSSTAGNPAVAWLGVQMSNLSPATGVMLASVVPGGPADRAGLEAGDVITLVENRQVHAPSDVVSALAGMHPGQQIELEYDRGPILHTTLVTLRARPANGP